MSIVTQFMLHNTRGQAILDSELLDWKDSTSGNIIFGPLKCYTWLVAGIQVRIDVPISKKLWLCLLPDNSGFLSFEGGLARDNCVLLDAHGKERFRLTVPWELTGRDIPQDAEMYFCNVCDHMNGTFGVSAWIEYAGLYYFELDYHTGKFLWGKEIRD